MYTCIYVGARAVAECRQVFALITKQRDEHEKMLAFCLIGPPPSSDVSTTTAAVAAAASTGADASQAKDDVITLLCQTIARAICRTNHVSECDVTHAYFDAMVNCGPSAQVV